MVASTKYVEVIHFPKDKDTDYSRLTTTTQMRLTEDDADDGPASGTQEATAAIYKRPRTTKQRPGMSLAVSASGYWEAAKCSCICIGAPARTASGPQESGSGIAMPAMLRILRVGR